MKSSYNLLDALKGYKNKKFSVRSGPWQPKYTFELDKIVIRTNSHYAPTYTIEFDEIVIKTNLISYITLSESKQNRSKEYLEIYNFLKELYDEINCAEYQGFIHTNFSTDKEITVHIKQNEFETEQDQLINAISNNMYHVEKEIVWFEFRENESLKNSLFSEDFSEPYEINPNVYNETVDQLTEFIEELRECASS